MFEFCDSLTLNLNLATECPKLCLSKKKHNSSVIFYKDVSTTDNNRENQVLSFRVYAASFSNKIFNLRKAMDKYRPGMGRNNIDESNDLFKYEKIACQG